MTEQAHKKEVGYTYGIVADTGNRKQISITGNFPIGVTLDAMNAGVDLLTRVADRQQAKSAWSTAKDKLECLEERLRLTLEDHARVLAEYGDKHVTVNEKQALARTKDSINQLEVEVESEKLLVERFAKEAA
jgi:hypothetical protein